MSGTKFTVNGITLLFVLLLLGDHLTKEHLEKNPYHKLPFIKDGDFPLSEWLVRCLSL